MFLRNIFEALERTGQGKSAVVGWGRGMGHKGHMFLASSVITQAKETGSDPYFVVSKTVGKDDPINPDEKLAIYKKVFPQSGHIFQTATDEMPDLTRVLTKLNQMGYTDATVVVGADQVNALGYVKNYNGKPDKSGNIPFSFNTLNVISRQETNDPSKDQEGPRATPMRAVLMDPSKSEQEQFAVWRDAMNPQVSDDEVRDLMMKAKERMTAMNAPKPKKGLKEMDKSQTPPGRDGHISHGTYGSRDKKDPDAGKKQYTAKAITAKQASKTATGILNKAFNKEDTIKELSNDLLGRYKKAAAADASAADKAGDTNRADKRFSGIVKATKKQFANDEKNHVEQEHIVKVKGGYELKSKHGNKNLGKYPTKAGAEKRERQVQYFKHAGEGVEEASSPAQQAAIAIAMKKAGKKPKSESQSTAMAHTAKSLENPPKIMQHRAKRDQERDAKWMSTQIAKNDRTSKDEWGNLKEKMLPKSAFAGSDKNKLGPAAHAKGKQKGPVKQGQFVGGMEEEKQRLDPSCWKGYRKSGTKMKGGVRVNNCVKVSESVENIMDALINKIITNEATSNSGK